MKFHLNHSPAKPPFQISHKDSLFLVGSCFAENIGSIFGDFKFNASVNPGGILFNPSGIYNFLNAALQNKKINEDLILEREGKFYSYLHHSSFSSPSKNELIEKINTANSNANTFLKSTTILIITFGTAYIYKHNHLDQIVSNCHKQPSDTFTKKIVAVNEIVESYSKLIEEIKTINTALKIIFTVSPVKHLKDGVIENSLSKSTLILAVHQLISTHKDCFYFPAYELVTDDLRDHRFYKEDLAHPNQQAIDYVWEKFSDCYFNPKTKQLNEELKKLQLALNHRKMQNNEAESEKLSEFIRKQKEEIKKLAPEIEF